MARAKKPRKPRKSIKDRIAPIKQTYQFARERDSRLPWYMLASFLVPFALVLGLGFLLGIPVFLGVLAVLFGLLGATTIFGRRANAAAYREAEGKPGAAMAIVNTLRGDWRTTPVVNATVHQDMVHRVLGKPGVILIGEGAPQRVRPLLAQEKKRTVRVAGDVPVYDFVVGNDTEAGEIPIKRLSKTLVKLPSNLSGAEVTDLERRMKALSSTPRSAMPKGPLPKGAKIPRSVKGQKVPPPPGR